MSWPHGIKNGSPLNGTRICHEEIESRNPANLGLGILSQLMGHQVGLKSANGLRNKELAFLGKKRIGTARFLKHCRHRHGSEAITIGVDLHSSIQTHTTRHRNNQLVQAKLVDRLLERSLRLPSRIDCQSL